ncbi:sodium-dependent proline hypothetical protein [Limosa lapponica baueri]|uniref:Transporter n=1 Tax=Limosa lapponica baueri TaxID=1758121 RepID=A0A2I0T800_LIMLA|nr:sodium-dependent proline hypothetical protein [Limosa lapponica baueri]
MPDLLVSPSSQDGDPGSECPEGRGNWTGRLDFLLSCIGYCVGLGNVWRFPYRAYTNGGGAFLIPYFIMLAICGIPIFFMELSLGQFSSLGPLAVWKISPLFKGYFLQQSRYVLHIQGSSGIGDPGRIRWNLCLCLLLSWTIVYLCILKGVKSSGKVVYFTATFPYLILVMLLIRGVTLEGAWKGIQFYLTPQFDHLLSSKVWIEAALQIFYSLGVGFGGLLTFASYNTFHQNIYRDTFIVTLGNAITSILAGFAIFSVLGYMSQELGVPVNQVAKAGMKRFCRDIHMMLGFKPGPYFRACWMVLSPATMMALLVYNIVKYQPSEYGSYRFPAWAEVLGILMGVLSCLMIPVGMMVAVLQEEGTLWERVQQASRPAMDWGPSLEENRTGMYVASLAGSQSPKPLMVHMRKYGGITSYENTAIERVLLLSLRAQDFLPGFS